MITLQVEPWKAHKLTNLGASQGVLYTSSYVFSVSCLVSHRVVFFSFANYFRRLEQQRETVDEKQSNNNYETVIILKETKW